MKKIILLLLFISISQLAICQETSRLVASLHQNLSLQQTTFRLSLSPGFGFQSNRKMFILSPVILIKNFPSAEEKSRLSGVLGSYRFNLSRNNDTPYTWFLDVTSRFQSLTERWTSNYWNPTSGIYEDAQMKNQEYLWENFGGIGIARKIHKQFEFQARFLAGYFFSTIKPAEPIGTRLKEEYDYRFYREKGVAFSIGVGINYYLR